MWSPSFRKSGRASWRQRSGVLEIRRRRKQLVRLRARARRALREPVEATLAVAMLGALALPLLVEAPAPRPGADKRSTGNDGDDGDDLDLEGAIASW
ncbi:hypothetical protein [Myxococcus sp. RHSTA-1-4]|uniref:hypothetical protein n=1 Tax=Myxococcus sp. RHSTA-1-4 TaxID=2874601 RepID=UPI001CBD8CD2|nr:hypothetical protein [Myxococcus sp. RHSTA-1-4]MBZ4418773.1 hypothetical protein [Myxococcus sp. RHSTA-1-4]